MLFGNRHQALRQAEFMHLEPLLPNWHSVFDDRGSLRKKASTTGATVSGIADAV
jgi:hypothetical protein